jgi:hypothetical protein
LCARIALKLTSAQSSLTATAASASLSIGMRWVDISMSAVDDDPPTASHKHPVCSAMIVAPTAPSGDCGRGAGRRPQARVAPLATALRPSPSRRASSDPAPYSVARRSGDRPTASSGPGRQRGQVGGAPPNAGAGLGRESQIRNRRRNRGAPNVGLALRGWVQALLAPPHARPSQGLARDDLKRRDMVRVSRSTMYQLVEIYR